MSAPARRGIVDRIWRGRSLRWQVMAAVIAINLCAALAAAAVVVGNARRATAIEINSSLAVAARFVEETVQRLADERNGSVSIVELPVHIGGLRHVRIRIEDTQGKVVDISPDQVDAGEDGEADIPDWFTDLVTVDRLERVIPVMDGGQTAGRVLVIGEASDEIAEVWEDMSDLVVLAVAVNIAILAALYLVLGRLLYPLRQLSAGLSELEAGRFEHRLPPPSVQELALIAGRFNTLGAALRGAHEDNARLHMRLITVQDDERRQIAADLHDELGPCLFGMRANLESVERLSARTDPDLAGRIRERLGTVTEILDRVQTLNRRLLRRIRPMALDHVPLSAVIADLIADFERHAPGRTFSLKASGLSESYGDAISITIYRCAQEAITNALRHGGARSIAVELTEMPGRRLRLAVQDDGIGIAPETAPGYGLIGIEERLNALGGSWNIRSAAPSGTRVEMEIPTDLGKRAVTPIMESAAK